MKISKFLLSAFILSVLFVSCDNDDDMQEPKGDYENGLLISGEGGPSGFIYYVSDDFSTTESQIYKKVNNSELSVYLQSMAFDTENAYICVDNQNTITVVDRYTFLKKGAITTDLEGPRYMTVADGIGYATNWGTAGAYVAVIDVNSLMVTNKISIGNGPERIIERNGKLYVSHQGGFGINNVISVIDIATEAVTEITVNDRPDELFFDTTGNLVVLCEGGKIYDASWVQIGETKGAISKINPTTNTVISEIVFADGVHPTLLESYGSDLYYSIGSKVYKMSQTATTLPANEFIDTEGNLYGMAFNNNNLYAIDANFSGESTLNVFSLASKAITNTSKAPIAASKIYFN